MTSPTPRPDDPATAPADAPAHRASRSRDTRRRAALVAAGVLAVAGAGVLIATLPDHNTTPAAPMLDRTNPGAVASAFVARYADGDPTVCQLTAGTLTMQLDDTGRCSGKATTSAPRAVALTGPQVCGDRAGVGVQITPAAVLHAPYALVELQQNGADWSVYEWLPETDRSLIQMYPCSAPPTDDFGG